MFQTLLLATRTGSRCDPTEVSPIGNTYPLRTVLERGWHYNKRYQQTLTTPQLHCKNPICLVATMASLYFKTLLSHSPKLRTIICTACCILHIILHIILRICQSRFCFCASESWFSEQDQPCQLGQCASRWDALQGTGIVQPNRKRGRRGRGVKKKYMHDYHGF